MKNVAPFFLLLLCGYSHAQNSLSGRVTDSETHEVLPGVTVYIHDLKKGSISNDEGFFFIDHLPSGAFLVEAKLIGYTAFVQSVQINGASQLSINLSTVVTELHEVVVTGISHSTELRKNPIPFTSINNQLLTENTANNIIDNISKKPGLSQINTGASISKPVIRGLSYNRVITLFDGIRQEGQQWGDEHGIEIDEFAVDRVEIIKGAGSLLYGSDGLGGVINFLTPKPVTPGSISGKWINNYQTNNDLVANSISISGNEKQIYWSLRGSQKIARAYSNTFDGRVFNSGFRELNFNGTAGLSKAWGYSELSMSTFNQRVGLVEGDRNSNGEFTRLKNDGGSEVEATVTGEELKSYKLFIPNQTIQHFRISNTSNIYLRDSRIQFNAGYQRNQRKEFGNVLDTQEKELHFDLHTINYNLIYFFDTNHDWQLSAGTSGMAQQNINRGVEALIPEYHSFDWGIFGFVKRSFGKFDLSGGVRYDHRTLKSDSLFDDDLGAQKFRNLNLKFENISASLGATYEFSKSVVGKLNASRGFRAPNISELASNGRHEGTLRYEYGNSNLKPETSFQLDVGLILNSEHISIEVSVYQNIIDNYIYTRKLVASNGMDSIPDPADPAPAYHYVQGRAQLAGGELTVDIHPHPLDWLHFENSFSMVRGVNKTLMKNDSSKYLPFMPAPRLQSELRANIKKLIGHLSNSFIKIELAYTWKQNQVLLENKTETPTPAYSIWNAGIGTEVKSKKGLELFSFYFSVNNLLNKSYQNHLSRLKYAPENEATGREGVFNMGRNFSFKIAVPLTFRKPPVN